MRERASSARRLAGLVAAAALLLPATASAAKPAPPDAGYKVLVVRSTEDAVSSAGLKAIRQAAKTGDFTVVAPEPADTGDQFRDKKLEEYRVVVFLDTGLASPPRSARASRPTSATVAASSASARRSRPIRPGSS